MTQNNMLGIESYGRRTQKCRVGYIHPLPKYSYGRLSGRLRALDGWRPLDEARDEDEK